MNRRVAGGTSRFHQTPSTGPLSRTSGFAADPRLEAWITALLETPGLTAIRDRAEAWRVHVEDSLAGVELVRGFAGAVVDVGSGGGAPGIPLAAALPDREVTLLEASERKCAFLERAARAFPNVRVVRGRAEEHELEQYGLAVAKALAPPPVAAEWCLPLVRPGGGVVLWVGPTAKTDRVARVAERLAAELDQSRPGFLVLRKLGPTPPGFPRRVGVARKRPLG
jgi:16S rRNA (guanine527-N7)-methyltransferase